MEKFPESNQNKKYEKSVMWYIDIQISYIIILLGKQTDNLKKKIIYLISSSI